MKEATRTGSSTDEIKQAFLDNLQYALGRTEQVATKHDFYFALALTIRDRVLQRTVESLETYGGANARRVAYLSAEYLPGPPLANRLLNLGVTEPASEAMRSLGHDLDELAATLLLRRAVPADRVLFVAGPSSRNPNANHRIALMQLS